MSSSQVEKLSRYPSILAVETALSLQKKLTPLSPPLSWFYVVCDVFLLIISALLLLAFWSGRFAQSWRMIAAAAFSLYIADMWFNYAQNNIPGYQRGFILEFFWYSAGFCLPSVLLWNMTPPAVPAVVGVDGLRKAI